MPTMRTGRKGAPKSVQIGLCALTTVVLTFGLATVLRGYRTGAQAKGVVSNEAKEAAYKANNIGVALLEQFKYDEGAEQFRRALKLDPGLAIAHLNLAVALFNEPNVAGSLPEAKLSAQLLPDKPQPFYMLGLIARSQSRTEDALSAFKRVLELDPADVGTCINLGQLYSSQRKYDDAVELLRKALGNEPYNITAAYNLAIALLRSGNRQEGQQMMARFQLLRNSGYGTTIDQHYLSQGRYAEAVASTGAEPDIVDPATPKVTFTDSSSSVLPPSGSAASQTTTAQTTASQATAAFGHSMKASAVTPDAKQDIAASFSGGAVLFDFDGDGDLDLFVVSPHQQWLYRNDCGKFVDITQQAGLASVPPGSIGIGAVAGDYDNDEKPDLFVLRYGGFSLYHNDGNGKFTETTKSANIPSYPYLALSAAFVDVDHDGDLDIFVAGFADLTPAAQSDPDKSLTFPDDFRGAPNLLLRNDGNGKFTDITAAAKVAGTGGHAIAVIPTDYDNHRDIDLFVANYGSSPALFSNQRDGTFRDVAPDSGLTFTGKFTSAAAGDFNKDGYTDFFLGKADGPGILAVSDGHLHFASTPGPPGSEGAAAAQFVDYDNDGLIDLVTLSTAGVHVSRNLGTKWVDVSDAATGGSLLKTGANPPRFLVSGDIDSDGDDDLVIVPQSGQVKFCRNDGGNANNSITVDLAGKVSNRSGVGSKVEMRAGSLWQKLETSAATPPAAPADAIFGLGKRTAPDSIRILWPSGTVQAEIEFAPRPTAAKAPGGPNCPKLAWTLPVTELDRKPSSCPFLYTWNGERFEFITDFMGGGEMGDWESPGQWSIPDSDEYVRIRGDQLKPKNGRYEIRVTNELEETAYVDRLQLVAVDHPADTEVYPNEGLKDPPRPPFKLYVTRNAHPPLSVVDDQGRDELPAISQLDRKYVDDFKLDRIRGYSDLHSLTMNVGPSTSNRTVLLMTGWTDYAFSSDNVAASQMGLKMVPPYVQVKDANGEWQTVVPDMGFPVGRPQTVVVDLTGKFLSSSREVRVVTSMRIYWDQILVDTSSDDIPINMTRLEPSVADLHWRGYSAETSPDGKEPIGYDYDRVSKDATWKLMPGRYTREGDVRELLANTDDMFVVSRPGDEISLSFDASRFPALPQGSKRTFLLYVDGFSKEMDINSASPDQVAPMPFHGMSKYPYSAPESYPMTPEHLKYIEKYNTRFVANTLPPMDGPLTFPISSAAAAQGENRKEAH